MYKFFNLYFKLLKKQYTDDIFSTCYTLTACSCSSFSIVAASDTKSKWTSTTSHSELLTT